MNRLEAIDLIERFLNGTADEWEWDDFMSVRLSDRAVEDVRKVCASLPARFPSTQRGMYCSPEGLKELGAYLKRLKEEHAPSA